VNVMLINSGCIVPTMADGGDTHQSPHRVTELPLGQFIILPGSVAAPRALPIRKSADATACYSPGAPLPNPHSRIPAHRTPLLRINDPGRQPRAWSRSAWQAGRGGPRW
jgi:hypothetical protein